MKKAILTVLGIIIIGTAFIVLMEKRTEAQDKAYQVYDNCVQSQYGMSAATYFRAYGSVPAC